MKYREDHDLDFLQSCSSEELDIIVKVLLHDKEGKQRSIVQLPNHTLYKQYSPNHAFYWKVIAGEIQRYGSNPFAALARAGRGKHYVRILEDVCGRFDVRFAPGYSIEFIERDLFLTIFERALAIIKNTEYNTISSILELSPATNSTQAIMQSLHEEIRLNDILCSYAAMIVAHGASMHASAESYQTIAPTKILPLLDLFADPIAKELEKISPLSLTGSAHWIIIPTVLQVVYLRAKKNAESAD